MSTQLNNDLESALGTIQAIQDIRAKYNIGNLNHSLAIPFAIQALNEFYTDDPVSYESRNIAKSQKGLVFNIEISINNRIKFIGLEDLDLTTRPLTKKFDYTIIVELRTQRLPRTIMQLAWEDLVFHLSRDNRGRTWRTYLNKQLQEKSIDLFPRRGVRSVLDTFSYYDSDQGLFLPAF
jgi:hypothetical protein